MVDLVDVGTLEKVVDSEEKGSTCSDELIVVASALVNEENAVEGRLIVEEEPIGVRKCVVVDELLGVEALADRGQSMMVASKSLEVIELVEVGGLAVVTRLVAETVVAQSEEGENGLDGLSIQEETTSKLKKSKDIAVPTYR